MKRKTITAILLAVLAGRAVLATKTDTSTSPLLAVLQRRLARLLTEEADEERGQ